MNSVERRVAKIEERVCPTKRWPDEMHVVVQNDAQTQDEAIDDYEAKHPGVNLRELMTDELFEISPVIWVRAVAPPWQKAPWLQEGVSREEAFENYHRAKAEGAVA